MMLIGHKPWTPYHRGVWCKDVFDVWHLIGARSRQAFARNEVYQVCDGYALFPPVAAGIIQSVPWAESDICCCPECLAFAQTPT